jgi:hypothetical protein
MKAKLHFDSHLCGRRLIACACLFAAFALSSNDTLAQSCVAPPSGLIDWWAADGDAWDIQGPHPGIIFSGASFIAGELGQAFSFDVTQHQYVDVGLIALPVTVTISASINPSQAVPGEY